MTFVSIKDAKTHLTELARQVEQGKTVTVTRNGKPVIDLVPHRPRCGLNLDAIDAFKKKHNISSLIEYVAEDFDDPLPEDYLIKQLP